jgi:hypothetical protein
MRGRFWCVFFPAQPPRRPGPAARPALPSALRFAPPAPGRESSGELDARNSVAASASFIEGFYFRILQTPANPHACCLLGVFEPRHPVINEIPNCNRDHVLWRTGPE